MKRLQATGYRLQERPCMIPVACSLEPGARVSGTTQSSVFMTAPLAAFETSSA